MSRDAGSPWLRSFAIRATTCFATLGAMSLFAAAAVSPALALPDQIPLVSNPGIPTGDPNQPINVMIVGDSITQGLEGDWTWRYRIWQWFRDESVEVCYISILFLHILTNTNIFRLILSGHGRVPGRLKRRIFRASNFCLVLLSVVQNPQLKKWPGVMLLVLVRIKHFWNYRHILCPNALEALFFGSFRSPFYS